VWHVAGKKNPADILSKHCDLSSGWETMKPIVFWNWKHCKDAPQGLDVSCALCQMTTWHLHKRSFLPANFWCASCGETMCCSCKRTRVAELASGKDVDGHGKDVTSQASSGEH